MKKVNTTSGALRAAKRYLWDGTGGWDRYLHDLVNRVYICDAIRKAYYEEEITRKAMRTATKLIMTRLGPCVSVGQWLDQNVGYRVRFGKGHNAYHKQVQAYRHRWLDALIIEYSSQGD
jgi:L-amino acid N-acyltransferase YncA